MAVLSRITIVLGAALLSSCAVKTEVQLYTQFLNQQDIDRVASLLTSNDYKVALNELPVPPGIKRSTLIYSPLNRDVDRVNGLAKLLEATDFGFPQLELTGKENHFYTHRTVGLYLLPEAITAQRRNPQPTRYSQEYNGRCESMDVSLQLKEDGSFRLLSFTWDEELDREVQSTVTGEWSSENDTMYLALAGQVPVAFTVKRRVVDGEKGFREYRLVNNTGTPFYDSCDFHYKELTY